MAYKLQTIEASMKPGKKWVATFLNTVTGRHKTVHFGAFDYTDYTLGADNGTRAKYRARHEKDLTGCVTSAGYLSYYILWGDSHNIVKNITAYKKRFDL